MQCLIREDFDPRWNGFVDAHPEGTLEPITTRAGAGAAGWGLLTRPSGPTATANRKGD